jgi:ABC-type spermidine/putrescine transport system permease subunit II
MGPPQGRSPSFIVSIDEVNIALLLSGTDVTPLSVQLLDYAVQDVVVPVSDHAATAFAAEATAVSTRQGLRPAHRPGGATCRR